MPLIEPTQSYFFSQKIDDFFAFYGLDKTLYFEMVCMRLKD
jgi:hypothetical protein